MAKFVANVAMLAVSWLVSSWLLMLGVGIVHLNWLPWLPTISFTLSLLICSLLLARGLISAVNLQIIKGINK
jgi:hypothetical protein